MRTRHIKDSTLCIVACQTAETLSFKMIQLIERNKNLNRDSWNCFQASPSPSISRNSRTKSLTHSLYGEVIWPRGVSEFVSHPTYMNPACGAKMATGIDIVVWQAQLMEMLNACNHVWQHLARMFVHCVVQDTPIPALFMILYEVLHSNKYKGDR